MGNRDGSTHSVLAMEEAQQRSSARAFTGSSAAHHTPEGLIRGKAVSQLVWEITRMRVGCEDTHQALLSNQALK